jgi:acetyl esterase
VAHVTELPSRIDSVRHAVEAPVLRAGLGLPDPALRVVTGRRVVSEGQRLHPEMQMLLRLRRLTGESAVEDLALPAGRRAMLRQSRLAGGRQPIGEVRDLELGDGLPARLYLPRAGGPPGPVLLFLHGGGFVYGGVDSHDAVCRFLAERSGVRVLSVGYRLAPEHPFPAPLEDAVTAYSWLREHGDEIGADATRVAVGGDSAGANLATGICLRARDAAVPQPRLQVLIYPVTDFSQELASRRVYGDGYWLTRSFIERCRAAYVLPAADPTDPLLSPLQAKELDGLAPAYVLTAGFDALRDEGEAYARRLADEGVQVEMTRHPGLIHGFANMVGVSKAARRAMLEVVEQLRSRL